MGLTQFDIIVLVLLAISAAVGFFRGAIREIAALVALVAAAVLAVVGLPKLAPFVRTVVHPDWLAAVATIILIFAVVYVALRLIGAALARSVHGAEMLGFRKALGPADLEGGAGMKVVGAGRLADAVQRIGDGAWS